MWPKIKNIIIFLGIAVVLVSAYLFFVRKTDNSNLTSTTTSSASSPASSSAATATDNSPVGKDFLTLLLSVKNIKLNDAIFSDIAFTSLRDGSIVLVPEDNQGRPNPFAPLGAEGIAPTNLPPATTNPNPPPNYTAPTSPKVTPLPNYSAPKSQTGTTPKAQAPAH